MKGSNNRSQAAKVVFRSAKETLLSRSERRPSGPNPDEPIPARERLRDLDRETKMQNEE
jgi:hypothetical protein